MKIKSIKKTKPKMVYAIKTSTGTFIADGLAHHNCAHCNWEHSNRMRGANPVAFSVAIVDKYGNEYLKHLESKSKESFKKPQKLIRLEELKKILSELKLNQTN